MNTEVAEHNGIISIHDYLQCIWENSNNFRRTWKLIHVSDMNYYFRDTGDGSVGIMNKDKLHSQIETGYYAVIPTQTQGQSTNAN
jgi:hypothetical protein